MSCRVVDVCRVNCGRISVVDFWSVWRTIVFGLSQIRRLDNDYIKAHSCEGAKPFVLFSLLRLHCSCSMEQATPWLKFVCTEGLS